MLLSLLLFGSRIAFLHMARRAGKTSADPVKTLRPAELAYLTRGDMSNVMIVLCFDLIHRAVKAERSTGEPIDLAPFERKAWDSAKDYVKSWSHGQIGKVLPNPGRESLPEMTRKVGVIYHFLTRTIRSFAGEIISDPRRIKKYISFAGVARLVADLASSGYQQVIDTELKAELVERGLIVPAVRATPWATALYVAAAAAALALMGVSFAILPDGSFVLLSIVFSFLNAAGVRMLLFLLELVPVYSELKDVLSHIDRSGWRISVIRGFVGLLSTLVSSLLVAIAVVLVLLQSLLLKLLFGQDILFSGSIILILSINMLCVFQLFFDGAGLTKRGSPTNAALSLVEAEKKRLSRMSPVSTLRQLLTSSEYDPSFSLLLAIYGIETLWLLI